MCTLLFLFLTRLRRKTALSLNYITLYKCFNKSINKHLVGISLRTADLSIFRYLCVNQNVRLPLSTRPSLLQLVLLIRDQKTSSESEGRCDSDTAKTSSTICRQAAPRLRRPLTDILTDNIDIQNVNPCSDEQSSDLLNYSRFGRLRFEVIFNIVVKRF